MRKAVNIWLERVIGGRGHLGVDLILNDGTKLAYREQRNFGTPAHDATFANGILITDINASGVNDGASTKLSWASIEIYSH